MLQVNNVQIVCPWSSIPSSSAQRAVHQGGRRAIRGSAMRMAYPFDGYR